ncbi:Morphology and auto-aggregation control protein [uncultured Roseburia sp.]|uniref:LysR family transcriptional regulator n=1 Tax=Brotonthovivens ammoniilytica TaxID=2981725 RepID=A0ABT2TLH4_9FIRM|nr:LysR family transcriptional regulator [Brotonthovivens ammoniilytica]MCU6763059.1 LysR family transcriptional regulator [Brotonthovivens ammoniilytica]SCJ01922.1 Morphology and auto-aggregation control protein [uncultured Roseburia sp.]
MNTRQVEYFLAVAEELNFTRAAERLFVSQTAVTQQIKALEEQLGVKLFERTKKKVVLTPAGMIFQGESRELLHHIDAIMDKVRLASSGITGAVNIGFAVGMGNTGIVDQIRHFNVNYPNIQMNFKSFSPSALLKSLKNGESDLILAPVFDEKFLEGLCYKTLDHFSLIVVLPSRHVLAGRETLTRYDLRNEKLILACTEKGELGEDRAIMRGFTAEGINPQILSKTEDIETIFFMLSANMGVTILPSYLSTPLVTRGKLNAVPLLPLGDQVRVAAVWSQENQNPSLYKILPFLQ